MKIYIERLARGTFFLAIAVIFLALGAGLASVVYHQTFEKRIATIDRVSNEVARGIDEVERSVSRMMRNINGLVSISGTDFIGLASYYGPYERATTASGEPYDQNALVAAHRTLPFGSIVSITNLDTRKEIIVRINDRGPYVEDRIVDLTPEGARLLGIKKRGVVPVQMKLISLPPVTLATEKGRPSDGD